MHRQANGSQLFRQRFCILVWHIDDQQVLHHGRAQVTRSEALGKISGGLQLLRTDASAQNGSPNKAEAFLFLRMNPDVVTIDIVRWKLWLGGIEPITQHVLQFTLESFPGPALPEEKKLETRPFAMLTQAAGPAKELGNAANH